MEEALYIALPTKDYTTLIGLLIGLFSLLIFLYFVQNKKIKSISGTYRQISFLLAGLLSLILFATILFTAWNLHTIQPIKLYGTYMESYYGKTPYKDILRAGIYNDQGKSFINPQVILREDNMLVVEKKNKKVIIFGEENYDIREAVKILKEQMKKQ